MTGRRRAKGKQGRLQGEGLDHTGAIVRIYDGQCQASQSCEMTKEQTRMRMPVLKQSRDAKRRAAAVSVLRLPPTLLPTSLLQLVHRAGVVQSCSPALTPLTSSTEQRGAKESTPGAGPPHLRALLSQAGWLL